MNLKKQMKKVIYIYEINGEYKIGKADQRIGQSDDITLLEIAANRISEQLTAATRGKLIIHAALDVSQYDGNSTEVESEIHHRLEMMTEHGISRISREIYYKDEMIKHGSTEWFIIPMEGSEVVELVDSMIRDITKKSGKSKFTPYAYQAYIKALVLDQVEAGKEIIAAELAPRFGKTLWGLDLFNALCDEFGYQYLILPAYVLTAHSSFLNDFNSFNDFNDIVFVDDKDPNFKQKIQDNVDKRMIITTSLHTSDISKYDVIKSLDSNKKVAMVDEADFGAHTKTSKEIINHLGCDLKILITGTAIERAISGYDVEDIIQWSYTDMLLLQDDRHPILENFKKVA
tara:strand:- start:72 stop:1103 length:1032 start_codon:yes stop_codon:yes gene_type:complete